MMWAPGMFPGPQAGPAGWAFPTLHPPEGMMDPMMSVAEYYALGAPTGSETGSLMSERGPAPLDILDPGGGRAPPGTSRRGLEPVKIPLWGRDVATPAPPW